MGWLKKLFGGGATLAELRNLVEQKRFAEARLQAAQLAEQQLSEAEASEVEQLRVAAGDGLARLNLEEALALRRSGDAARAGEHLQLALEQVGTAELRAQIEQAAETAVEPELQDAPSAAHGPSSCDSCGPQASTVLPAGELGLPDVESRLELILTSYPAEIAGRYRQKSDLFLQALLSSHAGDDETALPLWDQVAAAEQDELYWFEFGAALGRSGRTAKARGALETALQLEPELLLATEALIPVLIAEGAISRAEALLKKILEKGQESAFCHAQLTMIYLQQHQLDAALKHTRKALAADVGDPSFLLLAASLFEQTGALDEAETVLRQLPAGGCGGGLSLPLAEFLLRQHRELAKVLDTFNAACRQEPENPRWQLRVAQTYLARNWRKEGLELLRKVAGDPRLDQELRQEAEQLRRRTDAVG